MKKIVFIALISFISISWGYSQKITTIIADLESHQPIADVFVFFDNSSAGAITDVQGKFELNIADYEDNILVFSHLNYELLSLSNVNAIPDTVFLTSRHIVLEEAVVVEKTKPRLRLKWLKRFRNEFLGEDYNRNLIRIINPEVLLFNEKKGKLTTQTREALIIENKVLGYNIKFHVESYESYKYGDLLYTGKVFFEPLVGSKKEIAKFKRNRAKTYQKSSRSFFAALVNQKLLAANYEIGYSNFNRHYDFINYESISADSLKFIEIRKDVYEINIQRILTITNKQIKLPQSAQKNIGSTLDRGIGDFKQTQKNIPRSYLWSKHGRIVVNKHGAILNAKEVEEAGYWASLRVATLLPLDYKLIVKKQRKLQ